MSDSNITTFRPKNLAPVMPSVPSRKMLAIIAEDLTPSLPEGMSPGQWLDRTESFVGQHPEMVLTSAMEAILSTFQFSPKKAEIIDAILKAYQRLGVALSDDAKRHLSYRKKMSDRYTLNADGVKRFADDAKITLVGYFTFQGPQANIILDALEKAGTDAIVDDVEKAIEPVQRYFKGKEKSPGDEVLERFNIETRIQAAYRIHGEPADHCGGLVATVPAGSKLVPLTSTWVAMSEQFRDRMRERYPFARVRNNPHSWDEAIKQAFWGAVVSRDLDASFYGKGLQRKAEDMIDRAMADLEREGRIECERLYRIDLRECAINLQALAVAETRIKGGDVSPDRVSVDGETIRLDTMENCAIARKKIMSMSDRINAKMGDLR
jgi:hypothetical protein